MRQSRSTASLNKFKSGAYVWFGSPIVILSALMESVIEKRILVCFSRTLLWLAICNHLFNKLDPGRWFLTNAATIQPLYTVAGGYAAGATKAAAPTLEQISPGYPASFCPLDGKFLPYQRQLFD
jgi:hypothetical protein